MELQETCRAGANVIRKHRLMHPAVASASAKETKPMLVVGHQRLLHLVVHPHQHKGPGPMAVLDDPGIK